MESTVKHIAKHMHDVHFGGNWTAVNLQDTLKDVSWEQAVTKYATFNTIAALVFHINYYVDATLKVLRGGKLMADDKYSYDFPPLESEADWQRLLDKLWSDAREFTTLIEQMPEERMWQYLDDPKYGNYFRNLSGIIEHHHYHLGQIVILKRLVQATM